MQQKNSPRGVFYIDRACKPGSVHVFPKKTAAVIYLHCELLRSSSPDGLCHHERSEQPRSQRATNQGVASDRVYSGLALPQELVSSYLAFPSLPRKLRKRNNQGGLFLLHFPGSRLRRTLSVILLYDARTFLAIIAFANIQRDSPTRSMKYYTKYFRFCQDKYLQNYSLIQNLFSSTFSFGS